LTKERSEVQGQLAICNRHRLAFHQCLELNTGSRFVLAFVRDVNKGKGFAVQKSWLNFEMQTRPEYQKSKTQ